MRIIYTYILVLLTLSVSCQRIDLPEEILAEKPDGVVGRKVEINFSTADLMNVDTRAIIDPAKDIETLHLILFDENGMLVEVCEATKLGSSDHGDHASGRHYTVTLTTTDKPRIIHYVANCPLDQIDYGHESSVIGNMYVDKNGREGRTQYETSYWARIEVPYIIVEEKEEDGKIVTALHSTIINKFQHVPLLRNYAEITITDATDDTFKFEGYTVYNVIDRGTVAPYNKNIKPEPAFQEFFYYDDETKTHQSYLYPQLSGAQYPYEGHVVSSAQLITELPTNADGTKKIFKSNEPFYVYERKISVVTDEEDKWIESPPHIIIKGQFKPQGSDTWKTYYYKMDLVYKVKDPDTGIDKEIKYYNILRNFMYQFTLTHVHDIGYESFAEAVAGAAGNNLSGSANASKLTNVSDNKGRLWVSYTDTTLVDNSAISLKYKYIPNYYDATAADYLKVQNDKVRLENIVGDVINGYKVDDKDITDQNSIWNGYRNITLYVKTPDVADIHYQVLSLKTNSLNLNRQIRYTLRKRFDMTVECTPKVAAKMMEPVDVDIKLPIGLTEDMFPLVLKMEVLNKTLAPDAKSQSIPVETGPSVINLDGVKGTNSFYYVLTIPTYDDYKAIPAVDNVKTYSTKWQTGLAANASTIYVDNKYFNQASDSWKNYSKTFSAASIIPAEIPYGEGMDASVSFTMPSNDDTDVTLEMTGLKYGESSTLTIIPTDGSAPNVKVTVSGSNKIVTVSGLTTTTTTGAVKVHVDADGYKDETRNASRIENQFGVSGNDLGFNPDPITGTTDDLSYLPVDFKFTVPTYYEGMVVNITLDGLVPDEPSDNNDNGRLEGLNGLAAISTYTFKPIKGKTTYTLSLKTVNPGECTSSLTLESEAYYYQTVTSTIEQTAAKYAFQSLTTNPAGSVRYGTGRDVSITFVLDATDNAYQNKEVSVKLVGLANDKNETSFIHKVGNNRTVTINNLKTTSNGDNLRITVEAAEYKPRTTTISQRTLGEFKNVKFNKTKVGAKVGEVVELSFNIDNNSYYSGMVVNLELDGLEPVDGLELVDGNYTYSPAKEGTHKINLRTTKNVEGNCTAQLKASGMTDSQIATVQQTAATYALKITNTNMLTESWRAQARYTFSEPLQNTSYTFKCWIKSSVRNQITLYLQNKTDDSQSNAHPITNIGADWTEVTITLNPGSNTRNSIVFNIADVVGDVYIDKVSLIRNNDANKDEVMINNDFDEYDLVNGIKVPKGWDTKINNSNNTNPVCSVEQVEGGYEP